MNLHRLNVDETVALIQAEDHQVLEAIEQARPAIVSLIEEIVPRFQRGGRLIYLGAGTSGRLGVLDASEAPPTFQIDPGRIIGLIAGLIQGLKSTDSLRCRPRHLTPFSP